MGDFVGEKAPFRDVVGFRKSFVRIAKDVVVVFFDVVWLVVVNEVALGLHRFFRIEVSRQKFVFDLNQFEGFLGYGFRDGGYACHVVADISNFVECKGVLIMSHRKDAEGIGGILAGHYRDDAFELLGARRVDVLDAGMRMRRVQNLAV